VCGVGAIISLVLNILVKAANGSRMPVFSKTGTVYEIDQRHTLSNNETVLKFLGDWIEISGEKFLFLKESIAGHFAAVIHFPIGVDIVASPGDVGMWVFGGVGLLAVLLPIAIAFRFRVINKK
jgi:hypothetical protein